MKKKIWAICLTLVLALAAFAISGCSLFNNVGTIEWVEKPATEYSLGDTTGLKKLFVILKIRTNIRSRLITSRLQL